MSTMAGIMEIDVNGNIREGEGDLTSLALSLDRFGIIQPLVVTEYAEGENPEYKYLLVAGHRRLAAAISLGWTQVPIVVSEVIASSEDVIAVQYHENVNREDLTAWEEAQVAMTLKEEGLTQEQVADELGLSKGKVAHRQKMVRHLTELPHDQLNLMSEDGLVDLSEGSDDQAVLQAAIEMIAGGQRTDNAIFRAQRELEAAVNAEAMAKRVVLAREDGATFVDEQPARGEQLVVHRDPPSYQNNLGWERLTVELHRLEDCHVYYIMPTYTGEVLVEYCKSPARHREKGKSEMKEADAETKAEVKATEKVERKAVKDAKEARRATVASILRPAKWTQKDVLDDIVPAVVTFSQDTARNVATALDLEKIESKYGNTTDYQAMCAKWLEGLPYTKQSTALIVAVAASEYIEGRAWTDQGKAMFAWFDERTVTEEA